MAERFSPCSVAGCDGNSHYTARGAKGMCGKHYLRFRRNGHTDLLGTERGALMAWINDVALAYEGDDCLVWPFGFTAQGYCLVWMTDKHVLVHRLICEMVYGPAPFPKAEAAHSCGRGQFGCLNKKHLRWATHAENMMDRFDHGWSNRGEHNTKAQLTDLEAAEIKRLLLEGEMSQAAIARKFGVKDWVIHDIRKKKNWAHIEAKAA